MREKLIDIILAAQGYDKIKETAAKQGYWTIMLLEEMSNMRWNAGKIADALLAAGVVQEWVSVEDALLTEANTGCLVYARDPDVRIGQTGALGVEGEPGTQEED